MTAIFGISRSFIVFCCVGVFNTLVNYGVFLFFLKIIHLPYVLSGALGFMSGAITGFFLNRSVTFQSGVHVGRGLAAYLAVQLVCLGVHSGIQYICVHYLGVSQGWSQLPGIVVTTFLNYALSRKFVFAGPKA